MDINILSAIPPWEWPESAAVDIQKVLTDPRAAAPDRMTAADLAGEIVVINDELAAALLAIVRSPDESEELRAKAAISFGPVLEQISIDEFEDPEESRITEEVFDRIRDSLHEIVDDENTPKEVRRRALEASIRNPEEWHKQAIRKAYASGDREWVLAAVFAMGHLGGFKSQILESLKNPDPEIHWEAVRASSMQELDGAWNHVLALVKDPGTPKDLRLIAIEALGNIHPKKAEPILFELSDSEDEEIADAAKEALGMADFDANEEDL